MVSLHRLIVREVANQERGLFLITESSTGPEMYEIHTHTREERNTWLTHLTKAAHRFVCVCVCVCVFMEVCECLDDFLWAGLSEVPGYKPDMATQVIGAHV